MTHADGRMTRAWWGVIVPVKPARSGKSRLRVADVDRERLARAIALDTIAAARSCRAVGEVVVVTDDEEISRALAAARGIRLIAEGDRPRGIDAAVALGAGALGRDMPRAALLGDLPALAPADLEVALALAATRERGVVADAEGFGSTLVTAAAGHALRTAFGEDSLRRHIALGCARLELPTASTLRRDVDTADQLTTAAALGLGPRTSAVVGSALAAASATPPAPRRD
ncbi:2-phospho-L-lactate guanylyltransferase [Microbacterium limosum]|uniref:2-phospho-L-lactate guanylyltransferase n=1 Tax=Microbacterium limosum TaxID=3079935 RepID=A0AAU0MHC8_9MICO|nr:2-phospho-L-lactate guanylyltransferase [Microbacterium sp. Y20]WOQ69893.1 2-phospho-L-lactate guanylyltransferase [Microbacterium sp. Y20]